MAEVIDAWIYDQDGKRQPFPMADTPFNRLFAEWLRVHDRYTPAPPAQPKPEEVGNG